MDIYAPLASRLGLNGAFNELQDLALRSLHPWRYSVLQKALATAKGRKRDGIQRALTEIQNAFVQADMPADISGREKSLYSIYTKMREKQLSFSEVLDVYGLRILLPTLRDCYTALGVVHQLYKPLPGKFKDYIAIPKPNGYQSLHTVVSGPAGMNIEVQLRSFAMHKIADSGVAAHWLYKTHTEMGNDNERVSTEWLQSLMDIQQSTKDAAEFWEHVRIDLFPDDVYVMTPKGEIISLPRGATVVDFAYAIHSNVGDKTVAAKINDSQVPLRHEVKNGDTVEVITGPSPAPNPAWLSFVRTGRARAAIRNHLKNMQSDQAQALGRNCWRRLCAPKAMNAYPLKMPRTAPCGINWSNLREINPCPTSTPSCVWANASLAWWPSAWSCCCTNWAKNLIQCCYHAHALLPRKKARATTTKAW